MTIEIDDTLWGIPVGGIFLGFRRVESGELVIKEIPVEFFQGDKFANKTYLDRCVTAAKEALFKDLKRKSNESIWICSGYVLSSIRKWLDDRNIRYKKTKITGALQNIMERKSSEYISALPGFEKKRSESLYNALLEWVREKPDKRLQYAKSGWKPFRDLINSNKDL